MEWVTFFCSINRRWPVRSAKNLRSCQGKPWVPSPPNERPHPPILPPRQSVRPISKYLAVSPPWPGWIHRVAKPRLTLLNWRENYRAWCCRTTAVAVVRPRPPLLSRLRPTAVWTDNNNASGSSRPTRRGLHRAIMDRASRSYRGPDPCVLSRHLPVYPPHSSINTITASAWVTRYVFSLYDFTNCFEI